jgi:hypothetical protein
VFIPQILIIPSAVPCKYTGLRFPLRVAFAMTVNRTQGQVLILRLIGFFMYNYLWRDIELEVRQNHTNMPQQDVSEYSI